MLRGEAPPPDLCDVSQRLLVLDQHLGQLQALLRTDAHHIPEQEDPVRGVPHLHTHGHRQHGFVPCSVFFILILNIVGTHYYFIAE